MRNLHLRRPEEFRASARVIRHIVEEDERTLPSCPLSGGQRESGH
jgi:hypothetical protein